MNSLHLFAGIGGGILADAIIGNLIEGAVEINPYCRSVLLQRQNEGFLPKFPIFDEIRAFQGDEIGPINLVCGGFPCQDISTAGKGVGVEEGEKSSLFYELIRVCEKIRPYYIFLENSPAIISRGLDSVLKEIARLGYDAEWSTLSAGTCGAPHLRNRWWCLCKTRERLPQCYHPSEIVKLLRKRFERFQQGRARDFETGRRGEICYAAVRGLLSQRTWKGYGEGATVAVYSNPLYGAEQDWQSSDRPTDESGEVRDSDGMGRDEGDSGEQQGDVFESGQPAVGDTSCVDRKGWWEVEPPLGRVANGIPHRVDSLKGLGNAQVPACAILAFYCLMERLAEAERRYIEWV